MYHHLILALLLALVASKDIYISPFGSNTNSGAKDSPLRSFQTAISLAETGDVLIAASGLYSGVENQGLTIRVDITIRGDENSRVVISCQSSGRNAFNVFSAVTFRDISIQYCSNGIFADVGAVVKVDDVNFEFNTYAAVGGINANTVELLRVQMTENARGVYFLGTQTITLVDNYFKKNSASGFVSTGGAFSMVENAFLNNTGSFTIRNIDTVEVKDSIFEGNRGPALGLRETNARITGSIFNDNVATNFAGALYIEQGTQYMITDCGFNHNQGGSAGAIYCDRGSGNIFSTSFTGNTGRTAGAYFCGSACQIFFDSTKLIDNTPEWSNNQCRA